MTTTEMSEKKIKEELIEISAEDYLKKEFTLLKNVEYKIDFHLLWKNNKNSYYRINFWARKEKENKEKFSCFQSNYINRSYFVKLIKDGINWKHEKL